MIKVLKTDISYFCQILLLQIVIAGAAYGQASVGQDVLVLKSDQAMSLIHPLDFTGAVSDLYTVVSEPLFLLDSEGEQLKPWLADEFASSSEGAEWQVTLREGVTWSDGEAFTTADVEFTFDVILENDTLISPNAVNLRAQVGRVSIIDERTFKVYLREPNTRFLHELLSARREGIFFVLPKHIWEHNLEEWQSAQAPGFFDPFIGTGAYVLVEANPSELVLDRNPDWWGATTGFSELPEPERVLINYYETDAQAVTALIEDKLDVGPEISALDFDEIASENPNVIGWSADSIASWPGQCPRQLDINAMQAPWNDANLRKAISHFVDQQRVITEVYKGQARPAKTLFPELPAFESLVEKIAASGYAQPDTADIAKGDAELVKAEYTKNDEGIYEKEKTPLSITIHVSSTIPEDVLSATVIKDTLLEAGILASLVVVDDDELWGKLLPRGEFEAVYSWLGCGSVVDPYTSLKRYHPNNVVSIKNRSPGFHNMARWTSQAFGQKIDQMQLLEPGAPEIEALTISSYELISKETPFVPIIQSNNVIPFSTSRWKGWPVEENPYAMPMLKWGQFHSIIHSIEKIE